MLGKSQDGNAQHYGSKEPKQEKQRRQEKNRGQEKTSRDENKLQLYSAHVTNLINAAVKKRQTP